MKNHLFKRIKAILLSITVLSVTIGCFGTPVGVSAADATENETGIKYVEYGDTFDYDSYFRTKAPEYTSVDDNGVGYLFGGWYNQKDTNTYEAITTTEALNAAKTSGTIVAKFVPAQVLSVKCQNWAGTTLGSNEVIVRVISAVDSMNYSSFGFKISKIANGVETELGTYRSNDVYSRFNYYATNNSTTPDETYVPSDLFGNDANHFISCTVGKIPAGDHGTIICIKPFWVTLDGVEVNGLSKFAHVEDGYLGYVNVPVNLNILSDTNKAAAGSLKVACESQGLTFIGIENGVECGKVFDEMEVNADSNGTIICVGNSSNLADKTDNDIYINLKFQRTSTIDKPEKGVFYKFIVSNEQFCDSIENLTTADVWNIIY